MFSFPLDVARASADSTSSHLSGFHSLRNPRVGFEPVNDLAANKNLQMFPHSCQRCRLTSLLVPPDPPVPLVERSTSDVCHCKYQKTSKCARFSSQLQLIYPPSYHNPPGCRGPVGMSPIDVPSGSPTKRQPNRSIGPNVAQRRHTGDNNPDTSSMTHTHLHLPVHDTPLVERQA